MILTSLLLADERARERVVARARRYPRLRMVVATDFDRVADLVAAGCTVEHLPSPSGLRHLALRGDLVAYLTRRWQLIMTKWEPSLEREEGTSLADYLRACRAGGPAEPHAEEQSDASSLQSGQGQPDHGRAVGAVGLRTRDPA